MHSYLRSIGFSNLKRGKDIEALLNDICRSYDEKNMVQEEGNQAFVEYSKSFGTDIGISVCGTEDESGFHLEYYFPYFIGSGITTREDMVIEKRSSNDSFAGICEDMRIGVSLIFYLQNAADYKKQSLLNRLLNHDISTTFSGLATQGKILLPVCKSEEQIISDKEATKNRSKLIAEARNGDEDAIESLTLEDIDTYSMVSRRILQEDVFSIVDTFFMPYGMECDQYQILGEIISVSEIENKTTNEKLHQLTLTCNEITFDICINKLDLQGDPVPGRRFKGVVWLQGHINFPDN